jgi:hypothetical protein
VLAAGILAGAAYGCGGGGHPRGGPAVVKETFASGKPVQSGRVNLVFGLGVRRVSGSHAHGESFLLHLSGPFQSRGAQRLPRFQLAVQQRSSAPPARALRATATSTGTQLFIGFGGRQFLAPPATERALEQGYARAGGGAASANGSPLASLGIDPGAWLTHPRIAGSRRVGGVDTVHVVSGLNVSRFLADASALSSAASPLALGAGAHGAGLLPRGLATVPAGDVRVARVDLFTGAKDHLPRRLSLRLTIAGTPASLGDVRRVTLTLVLGLSALNQPQRIVAPSNPRPPSELARLLGAHS